MRASFRKPARESTCDQDTDGGGGERQASRNGVVVMYFLQVDGDDKDRPDDIEFRPGALYPCIREATAQHHNQDDDVPISNKK